MVLKTAIALSSNGKIVKQMLEFGANLLLFLLFLIHVCEVHVM